MILGSVGILIMVYNLITFVVKPLGDLNFDDLATRQSIEIAINLRSGTNYIHCHISL